jgi:hypothetical protein
MSIAGTALLNAILDAELCRVVILSDNYRLSPPAATPPRVWAVG